MCSYVCTSSTLRNRSGVRGKFTHTCPHSQYTLNKTTQSWGERDRERILSFGYYTHPDWVPRPTTGAEEREKERERVTREVAREKESGRTKEKQSGKCNKCQAIYIHIYIYMYVCVCIHTHTYIHIHTHKHTCTHTHAHTRTHTHTHTHTRVYNAVGAKGHAAGQDMFAAARKGASCSHATATSWGTPCESVVSVGVRRFASNQGEEREGGSVWEGNETESQRQRKRVSEQERERASERKGE